jgi:acetate kinase
MRVLVINAGSSSVKYQVIEVGSETSVHSGVVESVDYEQALFEVLERIGDPSTIDVVGHRVVHGGERFVEPTLINQEVETHIQELSLLAPLHNPANLAGIRAARSALPGVPQVAVFDTAFHQSIPVEASTVAIPEALAREYGIRKYGFHGTSHRYVSRVASELLGGDPAAHRIISVHLGNGSSIAAIKGGKSLDTSMGFTPLQGLVMGTRAGDIDPSIVGHLTRHAGLSVDEVDDVLNKHSGLLALSGSSDFRTITERASAGDKQALLAVDVWAWRIRHYIGGYLALLGGLDALVFTGGIGENSALGRTKATEGLAFLGIELDEYLNKRPSSVARAVSPGASATTVMVIPTNEELEIARQSADLIGSAR